MMIYGLFWMISVCSIRCATLHDLHKVHRFLSYSSDKLGFLGHALETNQGTRVPTGPCWSGQDCSTTYDNISFWLWKRRRYWIQKQMQKENTLCIKPSKDKGTCMRTSYLHKYVCIYACKSSNISYLHWMYQWYWFTNMISKERPCGAHVCSALPPLTCFNRQRAHAILRRLDVVHVPLANLFQWLILLPTRGSCYEYTYSRKGSVSLMVDARNL